jgi:hypothetical protein
MAAAAIKTTAIDTQIRPHNEAFVERLAVDLVGGGRAGGAVPSAAAVAERIASQAEASTQAAAAGAQAARQAAEYDAEGVWKGGLMM